MSLLKITRMRVKEGSPLNAVLADFLSSGEVHNISKSGKICVGSMMHSVKQYRLPVRMNKYLRCLRHDRTTTRCSLPRLCPKCSKEHTMEKDCLNEVRCTNCGDDHFSGNLACPNGQEKRRLLFDNAKKQRVNFFITADNQLHQNGPLQNGAFDEICSQHCNNSPYRFGKHPGRTNAQAI
jgi:hypothetical protein